MKSRSPTCCCRNRKSKRNALASTKPDLWPSINPSLTSAMPVPKTRKMAVAGSRSVGQSKRVALGRGTKTRLAHEDYLIQVNHRSRSSSASTISSTATTPPSRTPSAPRFGTRAMTTPWKLSIRPARYACCSSSSLPTQLAPSRASHLSLGFLLSYYS